MKIKALALAAVALSALSAAPANAALSLGDAISVQYLFPENNSPYDGPVTAIYTGAGQTITSTGGYGTFTLFDNSVTVTPGNFGFSSADFNGPALFDLTNANAFAGWTLTADTIGLNSTLISGNELAANWAGLTTNSSTQATFSAPMATGAVPEPATWAMMLAGFGMIGFAARRRQSVKTTVRFA